MKNYNDFNLEEIINKLLDSFKSLEVKEQVLDKEWFDKNLESNIDSTGFCFYASEVIYRLFNGKERWTIKRISKEDFDEGPHYFLYDKLNNKILDITSDQYTKLDIKIPYEKGKGRGLQNISKKAKILANSIGYNL